jgi:zinc transport system substrate-binding protein
MKSLKIIKMKALPVLLTVIVFTSFSSLYILVGCAKVDSSVAADRGKPQIVTTIFASYDFARQIVGDKADVSMLVPPGSETHSFEPTPQDIITLENCDLFIYAGGESDTWVTDMLASVKNDGMVIIKMIDCVSTVEEDIAVLADPSTAEEEGELDEHVWTSLKNAAIIAQTISDELCKIDANDSETYERNVATFCGELTTLDKQFKDIVAAGQRNLLVFGDRFPFRYFADEYGLECKAAFPGCSTATEASAQTVAALVDVVEENKVPLVLYRELSDHKIADSIARETNTTTGELHSCHNISRNDFNAGATYISIMQRNADVLKVALA